MRVRTARNAQPNAAHHALVGLAEKATELNLVMSNVNLLHERVGSKVVHSLHGDVMPTRCTGCGGVLRHNVV